MTTATVNHKELSTNELEMISGSLNCPDNYTIFITCEKCGKKHLPFQSHKCLVFPKMDADNRPAVTPPPFHPTCHQA